MFNRLPLCVFAVSLVVEERTRHMKLKVHRVKQTAGSGSSQELDREQYSQVNWQHPTNSFPFEHVHLVARQAQAAPRSRREVMR